jgi:hypothetical protein
MFVEFQRPGPSVFDGISKAVQRSDAWVAAPREGEPLRAARADHLVVNQIWRESNEIEILATLSNDFMTRRKRNEMSESLERHRIAVVNVGRNGRFE